MIDYIWLQSVIFRINGDHLKVFINIFSNISSSSFDANFSLLANRSNLCSLSCLSPPSCFFYRWVFSLLLHLFFTYTIPRSFWNTYSICEFCFAEVWTKLQKPFEVAKFWRKLLFWYSIPSSGTMRSDLFWTKIKGICFPLSQSEFSSTSFFHFNVLSKEFSSTAEQTITQPTINTSSYQELLWGTF